jgi:hypothetical protein
MKIIAFILALEKKPLYPLLALSRQTLKPDKVVIVAGYPSACVNKFPNINELACIVVPPNFELSVGERVGIALTVAFRMYNIEAYDYVVRLDEDFYFDKHFLKDNIRDNYDLIGCHGAMIIKSSKIIEILNGKWMISPMDDVLVIDMFRANGCKVLPWAWFRDPIYLRLPRDTYRRGIMFGMELYRIGYPLVNLLLDIAVKVILSRIISKLFYRRMKATAVFGMLVGYVIAFLRREKRRHYAMILGKFYKTTCRADSLKTILRELMNIFYTKLRL